MTGRPYRIDERIIQELETMFHYDMSIDDACAFVKISPQTYYDERDRNPEFSERMDKARTFLGVTASQTIARAIKDGDVSTSRWFKERRDERYKTQPAQINMSQTTDSET